MTSVLISVLAVLRGVLRSRVALHLEILALRHQLHVLQRFPTATAPSGKSGQVALGMALTRVEWLASGTRDRKARDRRRLASAGLPRVLDVEEWSAPADDATARAGHLDGPTVDAVVRRTRMVGVVGRDSVEAGDSQRVRHALDVGDRHLARPGHNQNDNTFLRFTFAFEL
jgi:hypothetical protein